MQWEQITIVVDMINNKEMPTLSCFIYFIDNIDLKYNRNIEGRKDMFYLATHSTHFIHGYMASDVFDGTICLTVRYVMI